MTHNDYKRSAEIDRYHERELMKLGRIESAEEYRIHAERMERMAALTENAFDLTMPSFEEVYSFLRDEYLNSRFEGRNSWYPNGVPTGGSYSELIAKRYLEYLRNDGVADISHFESRRGKPITFNRQLVILNDDAPVVEINYRAGSLASPMSGDWG